MTDAGPALAQCVSANRVGAAALSLGLKAGAMAWLKLPHPPDGATTLGLLKDPRQLGQLLLVLQGFAINLLARIDYPLWAPVSRADDEPRPSGTQGRRSIPCR